MLRSLACSFFMFVLLSGAHAGEPLTLTAKDGGQVHGEAQAAAGEARASLLLFHQAGANRGEYTTIAPRLIAAGFNVLRIDQRSGGNSFGQRNKTVAARGGSTKFLAVLPDLEAALAHAKTAWPGTPIAVWGSSYSASLVFLLAAKHPDDVNGVLAFSPGEYLGGSNKVRSAAARVRAPVFVSSSATNREIRAAKRILKAVTVKPATQYAPKKGRHGSSLLIKARNPGGAEAGWTAVIAFLDEVFPKR